MLIAHVLSELERERAMRVYVFPRLKKDGKLTEAEAALRLERLSGAMEICQTLMDLGFVTTLCVQEKCRPEFGARLYGAGTGEGGAA